MSEGNETTITTGQSQRITVHPIPGVYRNYVKLTIDGRAMFLSVDEARRIASLLIYSADEVQS